MLLHMSKTKILTTENYKDGRFHIDNDEKEKVKNFNLSGSIINHLKSEEE